MNVEVEACSVMRRTRHDPMLAESTSTILNAECRADPVEDAPRHSQVVATLANFKVIAHILSPLIVERTLQGAGTAFFQYDH